MVYRMKNAPTSFGGFGQTFRGQEVAGSTLAEYVDEICRLKLLDSPHFPKEYLKQPVILHGVSSGKSAMLSNGLMLHKQYCKHPRLQELLSDEKYPLSILIDYNGTTKFSPESETSISLSLIRRVLASSLGIEFGEVCSAPLGSTLSMRDCLSALLSYHKSVHGIPPESEVFVYLGIDEVNVLVDTKEDPLNTRLKELVRIVNYITIAHGFVSTVMAGTHCAAIRKSFVGSGVTPLHMKIGRLSEDAIDHILKEDTGVSDQYLNNGKFRALLRDVGPVMRVIGIIVSSLSYDFDETTIDSARTAAVAYLDRNTSEMTDLDKQALYAVVISGRHILPEDTIREGSNKTFDSLQNDGTISLIPSIDRPAMHSVSMSKIMLESDYFGILSDKSPPAMTHRHLMSFITTHSDDSFEKFVAHHHAVKKALFVEMYKVSDTSPVAAVRLADYFLGAWIGADAQSQELQMTYNNYVPLFSPEQVMWRQGSRYPETKAAPEVADFLKNGGVLLNSPGAAIDVMSCERVRKIGTVDWKEGVTGFRVKHSTVGDTVLSLSSMDTDRKNAIVAIQDSEAHSKAELTLVYFSNCVLTKDVLSVIDKNNAWRKSVIVHRDSIDSVVGPLWGRLDIICIV